MKEILDLGFTKNNQIINGYKPHFRKDEDLLFLIGSSYGPKRIYKMGMDFRNHKGKVFGVLSEKAPRLAEMDWITAKGLILLKLSPLSVGRWKSSGNGVEYVALE